MSDALKTIDADHFLNETRTAVHRLMDTQKAANILAALNEYNTDDTPHPIQMPWIRTFAHGKNESYGFEKIISLHNFICLWMSGAFNTLEVPRHAGQEVWELNSIRGTRGRNGKSCLYYDRV